MADFQMQWTAAGLAARAQAIADGTGVPVTSWEAGRAQRAATGAETGVTTQFSPRITNTIGTGISTGPDFQIDIQDDAARNYSASEIAIFSGATCIMYASVESGSLLTKPADADLAVTIVGRVTNAAQQAALTFTAPSPAPLGTENITGILRLAGANDNTSTDKAIAPARVQTLINSSRTTSFVQLSGTLLISQLPNIPTANLPNIPTSKLPTIPVNKGGTGATTAAAARAALGVGSMGTYTLWVGTRAAYNAINPKLNTTIYATTD